MKDSGRMVHAAYRRLQAAALLLCCLTLRCESFSQPPSASLGARITASRAKSSSSSNPLHANEIDDATVVTKSTSLGKLRVPPKIPFAVDKVSSSSSAFERVQRGLARLSKSVPKTVLLTVVAVASGLIFFELTKTLLMLALPVIAVLGGAQSVKDGLDDAANGPRIYDTDAVVYPSSSSSSLSLDELERMSRERSGRLAAIQQRISDTSGDLKSAITSASTLRSKLTSYADRIDQAGRETGAGPA